MAHPTSMLPQGSNQGVPKLPQVVSDGHYQTVAITPRIACSLAVMGGNQSKGLARCYLLSSDEFCVANYSTLLWL